MKKQIPYRNPENIDPSTIPAGWRFTLPEEHDGKDVLVPFTIWFAGEWGDDKYPPKEQPFDTHWTAITNAPLPKEYLEPELDWHNPHNLTDKQIETDKGWRLLLKEELDCSRPPSRDIQAWSEFRGWSKGMGQVYQGSNSTATYRVKWPLPAKYQKVSENENELDAQYEKQIASLDKAEKELCATVKEIEQRGQTKFLIASKMVIAVNPRHQEDPLTDSPVHLVLRYGKDYGVELKPDGNIYYSDGAKFKLVTVLNVIPV